MSASALRPASATAFVSVLALLMTLLVGVTPARAAGTIFGTISGDGVILDDVRVEVVPPGGGAVIASTTTAGGGSYRLDVDAGTYDLIATPPATSRYSPSTVDGVTVVDGQTRRFDIQLLLVDDGGGGDDVPEVTGSVSVDGSPLPGATVELQEIEDFTSVVTTTAGDGTFAVTPNGPSGNLVVAAQGSCDDPSLPDRLTLRSFYSTAAETEYPIDLAVGPLTVRVLDPDGLEVEGAQVQLFARGRPSTLPGPYGGEVTASTDCGRTTGLDGRVTQATAVGIGTTVTVQAPGYATTTENVLVSVTSGQQLTVQLPPPPVPVTGVVLGVDGTPRAGVDIDVIAEPGQPAATTATRADGSFSLELVPGEAGLILSGDARATAATGGPAAPFEAQARVTVPEGGTDLGTWQVPLAAVDLDVVLEGTDGELFRVRVDPGDESAPATVFGVEGSISNRGFGAVFTRDAVTPASAPLYLVPGVEHTIGLLTTTFPDGYVRPDPRWTITGPPANTRTTVVRELPLATEGAPLTGRILQDGQPVQNAVVAEVRGEFVRTAADGTFELSATPGLRTLSLNLRGSSANAPGFATGRLTYDVPEGGADLGDLELPYVEWDVRIAVPDGEPPIEVDLETPFVDSRLQTRWGPMTFRSGYYVGGGIDEDVRLLADGQPNTLWWAPYSNTFRVDVTPVGDTPYAPETVFTRVAGPTTLQLQLQREGTSDLPPTIAGASPVPVLEGAPSVALSVTATDPEGEPVAVTWDVLGTTPTGTAIDVVPPQTPTSFDAVATACDPAGNCASTTITVQVTDVLPSVTATAPSSVEAGEEFTLFANVVAPGDQITSVVVDWGDGTTSDVVNGSVTKVYGEPTGSTGPARVEVTVTDDEGNTASDVVVIEVAPSDPGDDPTDGDGDAGDGDTGGVPSPTSPAPTGDPEPVLSLTAGPTCIDGVVGVEVLLGLEQGDFPAGGVVLTLSGEIGTVQVVLAEAGLRVVETGGDAGTILSVDTDVTDAVAVVLDDCTDVLGADVEQDPDEPEPPAEDGTVAPEPGDVVAPAPDDAAALPATGAATGPLTGLGTALLALGLVLVAMTGRRRSS